MPDPATLDYWELRINNKAGVRQAFINSSSGEIPILSCQFETCKLGGCTTFEMITDRNIRGTIENGFVLEFWAKVVGGTVTQYWKGEIVEVPGAGSTSKTFRYRALGLISQMRTKYILSFYPGDDTDNLITDLITAEFAVDTDISTNTGEVSISSPYTLGDAEFELITASDALKMLADVQRDVDWGVDEEGKIYFKDFDTTVVDRVWIGQHIASYEPTKLGDRIFTDIIIQSKTIVGGGMLTLNPSDASAVTDHGRKTKKVALPHIEDPNDAWQYANSILLDTKDDRTSVAVEVLSFVDFKFPTGRIEVYDENGDSVEVLDILKVEE